MLGRGWGGNLGSRLVCVGGGGLTKRCDLSQAHSLSPSYLCSAQSFNSASVNWLAYEERWQAFVHEVKSQHLWLRLTKV